MGCVCSIYIFLYTYLYVVHILYTHWAMITSNQRTLKTIFFTQPGFFRATLFKKKIYKTILTFQCSFPKLHFFRTLAHCALRTYLHMWLLSAHDYITLHLPGTTHSLVGTCSVIAVSWMCAQRVKTSVLVYKKMAKKIEKAKMAYERARAMLKAKKLQLSLEMVATSEPSYMFFVYNFTKKNVLFIFFRI